MRLRIRDFFGRRRRQPEETVPDPTPAHPFRMADGQVDLMGMSFTLVASVDEFMAALATERRLALQLPTLRFMDVYGQLFERLGENPGDSPEALAIFNAQPHCAGCGTGFSGRQKSVIYGLVGAGSGELAHAGRCRHCGDDTALLVYECVLPSEIGEDDVDALRDYWRDGARRWWAETGRREAFCDVCSDRVTRADSYLTDGGTNLICARCGERRLEGALENLRENPRHFGEDLRLARLARRSS